MNQPGEFFHATCLHIVMEWIRIHLFDIFNTVHWTAKEKVLLPMLFVPAVMEEMEVLEGSY